MKDLLTPLLNKLSPSDVAAFEALVDQWPTQDQELTQLVQDHWGELLAVVQTIPNSPSTSTVAAATGSAQCPWERAIALPSLPLLPFEWN